MNKYLLLSINLLISLLLVIVIINYVGFSELSAEFSHLDLFFLFLSILSIFIMDIIMSYRIKIILDELKSPIKFLNILRSHFVGMLLSDFTPSRSGYFATAAVLRYNYDVPSDHALLSVFGPQIFDFAFKVIIGSIGALYIISVFLGADNGLILLLGAIFISLIVCTMLLTLFSKNFLNLFKFVEKIPILSKLYLTVVKMQESSHIIVKKTPDIAFLIGLNWIFRSLSWFFAAKSVGITLNLDFPEFLFYFFLQPFLSIVEFLPSPTIAGLGLTEGGATTIFSFFGVLPSKAASFALLVRFKSTILHLPAISESLKALPKIKI